MQKRKLILTICPIILVFSTVLSFFFFLSFLWVSGALGNLRLIGGIRPKTTVHKTINQDKRDLVVVSRLSHFGFLVGKCIFLEVWSDNKRLISYKLGSIERLVGFDGLIQDITLLPDTDEVEVRFKHPNYGGSPAAVAVYKIPNIKYSDADDPDEN